MAEGMGEVEAATFNTIRLGLLRLGSPMRMPLDDLRDLDLLLDMDLWLCVDRSLNDLPIVAWSDFQIRERDALHTPISCLLRYYHYHADLIMEPALNTAVRFIRARSKPSP